MQTLIYKMKKLTSLLFLASLFCIQAALAQNSATLPLGFPQNSAQNWDPLASFLTLGSSATLQNERYLAPTARFAITDNGPGNSWVLELATVPILFGGTGATTQQTALNNLMPTTPATGDIVKYDGANWVRLARGSANQILSVNGGGTDIQWSSSGSIPNASAQFILSVADGTMTNADVLTGGTGITITNGTNLSTVAIDSTVATLTGVQTLTNKELTSPSFSWNGGAGITLKGSANNAVLKWADWGASAGTITIPLVNGTTAANLVLDQGTQTLAGTYTFSAAPKLSTNTLTTSTGLTVTIPNATDSVATLTGTQTLTNKTLTSATITGASSPALTITQSTANYLITTANPGSAGDRTYNIYDANGNADFALKSGTPNAGGIAQGDGTKIIFTPAGTSGQPLISAGAGTAAFNVLTGAGGGTGQSTTTAGDLLVGAASNTWSKLAKGTANQSLQMDGTGTNVQWGSGGTGTVTSFSAGDLSPLFTTTEATVTTTPALSFALTNAAAYTVFGNNTSGSAAPAFQSLAGEQLPQRASMFGGAGGSTSVRALPTSGTLTGEYWHYGNWASTDVITCNRCRWHVVGTITLTHAITINTEMPGGLGPATTIAVGGRGGGPGGGEPGPSQDSTATNLGGGGGSFGGVGGKGGSNVGDRGGRGGPTYDILQSLLGSGGGAGCGSAAAGAAGGAGGGSLYVEATGNVSIDANITATGAVGAAGTGGVGSAGGGGGSGGGIDIRSLGTVTIQTTRTVSANGGAGGAGAAAGNGGGGGGGGGYIAMHGSTFTNSGTVTVTGGAAGANGSVAASAGATGTTSLESVVWHVRTAP